MGRRTRRRIGPLIAWVAVMVVAFCFWNDYPTAAAKRIALVIGNGAYEKGPLLNPVNDAHDMAKSLRQLGFEVLHHENADQRTMKESIRAFGRKLTRGDVGLFYFSGHGIQVDGRNYLIPIGAQIASESEVEYEAVDAGRVLGQMEDAGNDLNIVILDACRDNPFAKSFRSESRGLARMDAPSGSLIAYATAPGEVAADGTGRNGIFTKHLLQHMQTTGLTVERVLKKVRVDVMRETFERQVPWESSSLRGDFYFKPKEQETAAVPAPEKAQQALPAKLSNEALFWESIKDSNDPDFFRAYLEQYPEGAFAAIARLKLEKVQESDAEEESKTKQTLQTASVPLECKPTPPLEPDSGVSIVTRDGRYVSYTNGVVLDKKTNLEWLAGTERVAYMEAKQWINSLNTDGEGWRLPSMNELKSLYNKGMGARNMTPLLNDKIWRFWSDQEGQHSTTAWTLNFYARGEMEEYSKSGVLAVRSRNHE